MFRDDFLFVYLYGADWLLIGSTGDHMGKYFDSLDELYDYVYALPGNYYLIVQVG